MSRKPLAALLVCVTLTRAVAQEAPAAPSAPADHVVLISVDGLRPEFYLDRTWPAPTVQHMAREGAHALRVRTVYPSVTYPAHTTIITGALPARHGIVYNSPFEPGGETGRWFWETALIKTPTLWHAVQAAGRDAGALSWPVSVGAPVRWNVPEVWSIQKGVESLSLVRQHTTPPELWEELEREATGRITAERFGLDSLTREDLMGAMAAHLLATKRPALLTVHLIQVDHFQHEEGRDGPMVRRSLGVVDRAIGRMLEAAEQAKIAERTTFIVVGDHGFSDLHLRLKPNVWLAQAGLLEAAKDRGAWRAAFHTNAASAFLHLKDPHDSAALDRARQALAALPAGTRGLFRVLEREDLARLGADPAAALALAPQLGVTFSSGVSGPDVDRAQGGNHGFLCDVPELYTGFVASGAGVRQGAVVQLMGLEDVAPLVARLLGLDFTAPDGVAPLGVLAEPARR